MSETTNTVAARLVHAWAVTQTEPTDIIGIYHNFTYIRDKLEKGG